MVNQLVRQRTRLMDLVLQQSDELAREIELGAQVQERLLPSGPPVVNGFDIAGRMVSSLLPSAVAPVLRKHSIPYVFAIARITRVVSALDTA